MSPPQSPGTPQSIDVARTIERARAAWAAGQMDEAEMACRQALAAWPGQPDAAYLLGLIAYRFGNLDSAVAHMREACQSPRASGAYLSDFAEMCRQKGLLAEGEEAARRAVGLAPDFAAAWNNLGIILQEELKLDEARVCLERALALVPHNPETLNNLANTLKRLGRAIEAERLWTQALALKPDYAEALSNLANLYTDQGEYDRAESTARRAIELRPRFADSYINLAAVYTARYRYADALRVLQALLGFAPSHARALAAKALTLKELELLDEALETAKHATVVAPQSPESHNAIGQIYQAMGTFEAALAAYDRAAALPGPAQMDAVANRGALFMEFGHKAEAFRAMQAAADTFPNTPGILFAQTELKRLERGDPLIAQMQMLLAREGASLADRATLHFGLGKALLDIGDSSQAFHHYDEGNRLKRSTLTYDVEVDERWMASLAAAFSPELLAAKADLGARSELPVFIVGMPRSGTTLVEQILASHSLVHGAGELKCLRRVVEGIENFPSAVGNVTGAQLKALGEAYLAYSAPLAGSRRYLLDKMPSNFQLCGMIRLILPDARIIHCRRDPVDTCLSCYTKLFAGEQAFTYDQIDLGRFHRAYQMLMAHWRATLPSSHFLEVDYESTVDDIETQARRMLDFLNLPWEEGCLRFHETARPVRTASVNQVREPLYRTSAGRWRKHAPQLTRLLDTLGVPPPQAMR